MACIARVRSSASSRTIDLEQVTRCIGADHEDLRRVVMLVHVGDDVLDGLVVDAVSAC
jgi:hypothetical protein